jgi:hypothetical protein
VPVMRIVLCVLGSTRRCDRKGGERAGVVFEWALCALAASFALFTLVFSFAFSIVFIIVELKRIATARLRCRGISPYCERRCAINDWRVLWSKAVVVFQKLMRFSN